MAAYDYDSKFDPNVTLQSPDVDVTDCYDRRAEGTALRTGCLVIPGTAVDQVLPAGADALNVDGVIIGFWDSNGVYTQKPGEAIAAGAKVRICPKISGVNFYGLLPNTGNTTRNVKLKPGANGRLVVLAAMPAVTDALVYCADARLAVTSGADDTLCPVRWA